MKKIIFAVVAVCCMILGQALYSDDIPEDGMAPDYTPENVTVPNETLNENIVPVNEPEIEEKNELENDESRENSDYNTVEGEIGEIQAGERSITSDD
jgi:hypothetical protein